MSDYLSDLSSDDEESFSRPAQTDSAILSNRNHHKNGNINKNFMTDLNDDDDDISQEERDIQNAIKMSLQDYNIHTDLLPTPGFVRKPPQKQAQKESRELTIEEIIEQSQREEKETNIIREFFSKKENLIGVLKELQGVNPNNQVFEEFYNM